MAEGYIKDIRLGSPFELRDGLRFEYAHASTPGAAAAEKMYANGQFGNREIHIMRMLSETGAMTSNLIRESFLLPDTRKELQKFSQTRNPYEKEIRNLAELRLVTAGRFYDGYTPIYKAYFLSEGAHKWLRRRGLSSERQKEWIPPEKDARTLMERLSAASFHIGRLMMGDQSIASWERAGSETAGYHYRFSYRDGREEWLLSVRDMDTSIRLDRFYAGRSDKKALIILVPEDRYAKALSGRLGDGAGNGGNIMYCTDRIVGSRYKELRLFSFSDTEQAYG